MTTNANAARIWIVHWPTLREHLWNTIDDLLSPDERVTCLQESPAEAQANYDRQKAERDARIRAR